MNKRTHIILVFSALALLFVGTSCSSKKKMTKTSLREFTATRIIQEVENNAFDFDDFQAKISVKVDTDDKDFNVKGQLRMKKDSIIWTSISLPLGLEIVRVKIEPDSVFLLNRNDKTYLRESIEMFNDNSIMTESLQFLQSVLVGNVMDIHENDNYKVEIDDGQYNLLISKKKKSIWIDPQLFKITKYYIKEHHDGKRKIEIQYSDFVKVNEKYIPTRIIINIHGDLSLKAIINYSNISVGDNIDFFFNVPKKYERIYR